MIKHTINISMLKYIYNIVVSYIEKISKSGDYAKQALEDIDYDWNNISKITAENNRLSSVYAVDDKYIIKVVDFKDVNTHRIMCFLWNKSIIHITEQNLFKSYNNPYEMVKYEYDTLNKVYNNINNVNVPEPIYVGKYGRNGVLIIENINGKKLKRLKRNKCDFVHNFFKYIKRIHEKNLFHGDLHIDNVLANQDKLYLIDPTNIRSDIGDCAKHYDIACSIISASKIYDKKTVDIASKYLKDEDIIQSSRYITPISLQFSYNFKDRRIKNYIHTKLNN